MKSFVNYAIIASVKRRSIIIYAIIVGILVLGGGVFLRYTLNGGSERPSITQVNSQNSGVSSSASSDGSRASEPQNTTFQISAKNYNDPSLIYSTLMLSIPSAAFTSPTEVKIAAVPPTPCGNLSGAYLLAPQGQNLLFPAKVSITYTSAAVTLHQQCYSDFKETNLTLAYYDNSTYKYVPIQSTFDRSTQTVSGSISQFYSGGIMIVPLSLIH